MRRPRGRNEVFNRRNAVMGYIAWQGWKKVIRMKARSTVPSVDPETKKPNKSAVALALLGAVTVATVKLKRSGGDEPDTLDG
jgi:hypothetical protein